MTVKAFLNGNFHIKFNSQFMVRLNTEYGRMKGWLKKAEDAADEFDVPVSEAMQGFQSNMQLASGDALRLAFTKAA